MSRRDKKDIDTIVIIFPYNQHRLFVPDKGDWALIANLTKNHSLLFVSPNSLKLAKPAQDFVIMNHEMVMNFLEEIKSYISDFHIKRVIIIVTDIDQERVKRDFSLVFSDQKLDPKYITIVIRNSFWKIIYKIRERIVLALPISFYKWLGRNR